MIITFWKWFLRGSGGKAGYKRVFDKWILLHILVGLLLAVFAQDSLSDVASRLLLPIAGVLVGMSFAMTSSFHAVVETKEIELLAKFNRGGYEDYLYTFQLAFLILFLTLSAWALAGIGIFDHYFGCNNLIVAYKIVEGILYFLFSLSLRESWQVVSGTHMLILLRKEMLSAKTTHKRRERR